MRVSLPPILAIFFAGLVYGVLPRGAFGAHDVIARSAICAATAAASVALLFVIKKRSDRIRA